MLHCSHCLAHRQPDRLDDFVCCSGCGKVLGQFFAGKYIDHSISLFDSACQLKKKKKKKHNNKKQQQEQQQHHGKIEMDVTDPQLTT